MHRAFIMPVSAAVLGALLAVGVKAMDGSHRHEATFRVEHELADVREVRDVRHRVEREVREVQRRVERDVRREVERAIRAEVEVVPTGLMSDVKRSVLESLQEAARAEDLSDEERAKILRAIERLETELPDELVPAGLIEVITREDGSAHKDPVAPAVPDVPDTPAGSSGN